MQALVRLIQSLRLFWGGVARGIAGMPGARVGGLIPPLLIRTLVDQVLPHHDQHGQLAGIVVLLVLVQVASAGLVAGQLWMMQLVSYGVSDRVRADLYEPLQRLSLH